MFQSVQKSADISPCPVCKIDRRGRFVFINDEFEHVFGYSPENIHGKAIGEYVVEQSLQVIEHLLGNFSHCQSSYDVTKLVLIDSDRILIPCHVIFTLNFIGGNPVNVQMILLPIAADEGIAEIESSPDSQDNPEYDRPMEPADSRFLGDALSLVQTRLVQVVRQISNLGHRYYNRLGKGGNRDIQKLNKAAGDLNGLLDSLIKSVASENEVAEMLETDLALVIEQTVDNLTHKYPQLKIRAAADHLNKIKSDPDLLVLVLTETFAPILAGAGHAPVRMAAACTESSDGLTLSIELTSETVPPDWASDFPAGDTIEWLIARRLVAQLGGTLDVKLAADGAVQIDLGLPLKEPESETVA